MRRENSLSFLGFLFVISAASANELQDLYRGVRESAMGGASTAITEGEEAIFLNPAAMAGNKGTTFYLLNGDLTVSGDAVAEFQSSQTAFSNINTTTVQSLGDKNIYFRGTLSPAITFPHFGVSALVDEQYSLMMQNLSNPQLLLQLQSTNGFQFASGFSVLQGGRKMDRDDLRVGFGFKMMARRGGFRTLNANDTLSINQATVKNLMGSYGEGYSGDLGLQYIRKVSPRFQFLAGASYTELGGMYFSGGGDTQPGNFSVGIGGKFKLARFSNLTLAYDVKHLTQDVEWAKRNHLGLSWSLGNIEVMGGLNEGRYLTYGAATDLWLLRVSASSYSEEIGEYSGQMGERRYMLRITVKLGS